MRILCVVGLVSAGALVLAACASARRPGAETIAPSEAAADRGGTSNPVDEDDEGPAFENLTPEQAATLSSAETAARQLLQSPDFKALVTSIPASHERGTGWDHRSDPSGHADDDGATIFVQVGAAFPPAIRYQGYVAKRSRAIAVDGFADVVRINTVKMAGAGAFDYVNTIWHEVAHKADYFHHGNRRRGNECTVPHMLGDDGG
jgi:hypothetical protein